VVVPTPGHTPGHVSLIVDGEAFIGGDIAHTSAELPAPVANFCAEEHLTVLLAHDG